jgi:hypothetical protein
LDGEKIADMGFWVVEIKFFFLLIEINVADMGLWSIIYHCLILIKDEQRYWG